MQKEIRLDKELLENLVRISNYYGKDTDYVIAGGGNSSCKTSDTLWIKGSGTTLATITSEGFVALDREKLSVIGTRTYSSDAVTRENEIKEDLMESRLEPEKNQRPSVETSLHDLLGYRYVVHTHPWVVNALMCSVKAEEDTKKLFGDNVLYIPYIDPGYILFKKVQQKVSTFRQKKNKDPQVILLQNHGIFAAADTTAEIKELYAYVGNKISAGFTGSLSADRSGKVPSIVESVLTGLKESYSEQESFACAVRKNKITDVFTADKTAADQVAWAFTPDIIVYCKALPLFIPFQKDSEAMLSDARRLVALYKERAGYLPKILLFEGCAMAAVEENEKNANIILDVFEDAMKIAWYSRFYGGSRFMDERERSFIENWEVENYRRNIAKSSI
jgi:rhamnose utilization protein RhaD (predicted bifunctional aldolase and dehydrogenase)